MCMIVGLYSENCKSWGFIGVKLRIFLVKRFFDLREKRRDEWFLSLLMVNGFVV